MSDAAFRAIGRHEPRREDARLLTGRGRYIDDIVVPGALHACFVLPQHCLVSEDESTHNAARAG